MKTNRPKVNNDPTDRIRITLAFLQFIENKLLNKQVHCISALDMREIDGFPEFIRKYSK